MDDGSKETMIPGCEYHTYWCSRDTRRLGNNNHGIDIDILEYSNPGIRRLNTLWMSLYWLY